MKARVAARVVLAGVILLALVELLLGSFAYRNRIEAGDWAALRDALAERPPAGPLWLGTPWLGPIARRELPLARSAASVAPPDRHGVPHFTVLSLDGDDAGASLPDADLPPPVVLDERSIGPFLLTDYEQPAAGEVTATLLPTPTVEVTSSGKRCPRSGSAWRCPVGRVVSGYTEIEYQPRHCTSIDVSDGTEVTFTFSKVPLGTRLRGHTGFSDFNGRLRSDAPARIELEVAGETIRSLVVTDEQGWAPFDAVTRPGEADVVVRVTPSLQGTWQAGGYDRRVTRPLCVELRAIAEAT